MIRSLRWRLQLWHALVLFIVLAVFGVVVYFLQWQTRLQQIDAELDRTAEVLAMRVRRLMPGPPFGRPPFEGPGGPPRFNQPGQPFPGPRGPNNMDRGNRPPRGPDDERRPPPNRPPRDIANDQTAPGPRGPNPRPPQFDPNNPSGRPIDNPPWQMSRWFDDVLRRFRDFGGPRGDRPGLDLPEEFAHLFEGPEDRRMYFLIWNRDGRVLEKSASAPDLPFPALHVSENDLPVRLVRHRAHFREVVLAGRFETNILVGRSLRHDIGLSRRFAGMLTLAAIGVLGIGLLGGWWFTGRAIRPLETMTKTAESISAQNLAQRINITETDSELGQLAVVLNQTFDRLQAAFERQTRFTADASHELRTPVAVILAQIELSLARPRSEQDYREALATCLRASQRMKSLIENLLVLARLDAGAAELRLEKVALDQLVGEAVELIQPLADQRKIAITCELAPVTVPADRHRLSQVLTNLLTNAVRYNRDDGSIVVTVSEEAETAVVAIRDTGIGIAPEHLPHIFDRFFRVDPARSRSEGSSGLGLAICQSLVAAHHGTLTTTSTLGEGTTMELRLPRGAKPPAG
ncbi:MAG TPA: ATP-binding protein [Planctomycetaceae bacterium]|nr:ATP-binding protein [Planctomycetaceae bacterium]